MALTILNSNDMAIIPGLYGVWMLFTGFTFAFWMLRGTAIDPVNEIDDEIDAAPQAG